MNLQILSAMLEDHLTNEDIQEAQALLEWTYEEMVDIRCQLSKAQAEIDALKAQNAELLAALTESLAYVEATLSNHDAGCQRHPSTEHARDCILSDLDQIKTAIAKARGDRV